MDTIGFAEVIFGLLVFLAALFVALGIYWQLPFEQGQSKQTQDEIERHKKIRARFFWFVSLPFGLLMVGIFLANEIN